MPNVFVVQIPHRLNRATGSLEPMVDLSDAERFGKLHYLVGPNAKPFDPSVAAQIDRGLKAFKPGDFLLLVGHPILMGIATAYAADATGTVNFLSWSPRTQRYTPVSVSVFDNLEDEKDGQSHEATAPRSLRV